MSRAGVLTVFALASVVAAQQDLSPEVRQAVDRAIQTQRAWGPKLNSPGASLTAKEVQRGEEGGHSFVGYQLYAQGLPLDGRYELLLSPVKLGEAQVQSTGEVILDKNGLVLDAPGDPRTMVVADVLPGEPSRFALVSKDGTLKVFVAIQPNPIRDADHGCQLTVARLAPKFELALVEGTGFTPQSEIDFSSKSYDENMNRKVTTDKNGHFDVALLPAVSGKKEGDTQVGIKAQECQPKLKFHWGSTSR